MATVPLSVLASDGRTLAVAEWGDADGVPVFSLHGSPGSRLSRHYDESVYARAGARVITYDRPGYGGSDRDPGRRVVSCVGDVAAIADALGIERFAVTGGSGGGPHALAVAARLPDRVTRAACAVSPAPHDIPDFDWTDGMDPENVRLTEVALEGGPAHVTELERLAEGMLERVAADPGKLLDGWAIPESERGEVIREDVAEAFRNGVWGLVDDDLAILSPWGFDVSEIRVPTRVIYGDDDVLVPRRHGEWLAENVPGAEVVVEQDIGHIGSPELLAERVRWLVQPV
jgi:pimeloyl-ACP methyl ester carboxylesterase